MPPIKKIIKKIVNLKLPELHTHSKNKIEIELDLSNYVTKSDLKIATGVNTSDFAKKN